MANRVSRCRKRESCEICNGSICRLCQLAITCTLGTYFCSIACMLIIAGRPTHNFAIYIALGHLQFTFYLLSSMDHTKWHQHGSL